MEKLRINETPVRTSRNFLINNIEVELEMPEKIAEFKNVQIIKETSNIEKDTAQTKGSKEKLEAKIDNSTSNKPLTYGIGKISDKAIFYLMSRGLSEEDAKAMIVRGFAYPISKELPVEYAVEMNNLINLELEGAIG